MTDEFPSSGGSYIRAKDGRLIRQEEDVGPAPEPAAPPAAPEPNPEGGK